MQTATLINAFEVPPEADEPFIAGWERARDQLATRDGIAASVLHRALREDVALRFVAVTQLESPQARRQAIADPAFPGAELPFTAHPGVYETAREDKAPDGDGGAVLINPFEVPADADERFLAAWEGARDALAAQPGYLGTRLHRSLAPADFRFVNIARWSSPLALSRALKVPAFRHAAAAIAFPAHPALYLVVRP